MSKLHALAHIRICERLQECAIQGKVQILEDTEPELSVTLNGQR